MKFEIKMAEGHILRAQPGDIVVIKAAEPLTQQTAAAITNYVHSVLGPAQKVLVVDGGLDLLLLRGIDTDALPEVM